MILEGAAEEARRRVAQRELDYQIDIARREQNRAIAELLRVHYAGDFAGWKQALLFRVFVEQLRSMGIPLDNDPVPSQDEAMALQAKAFRLPDALRADPAAALPEIGGEGAGRV